MARRPTNRVGGANFDDLPGIHHGDSVADAPDDPEIMRDEDVGQPELPLQVENQLQDPLGPLDDSYRD